MQRFLVDESLPRSLGPILQKAGFAAEDVRDVGLRGRPDDEILQHASANVLILLTRDVGFGNIFRFPIGSHAGIVVVRLPNQVSILVIIEPGRVRLLRKSPT